MGMSCKFEPDSKNSTIQWSDLDLSVMLTVYMFCSFTGNIEVIWMKLNYDILVEKWVVCDRFTSNFYCFNQILINSLRSLQTLSTIQQGPIIYNFWLTEFAQSCSPIFKSTSSAQNILWHKSLFPLMMTDDSDLPLAIRTLLKLNWSSVKTLTCSYLPIPLSPTPLNLQSSPTVLKFSSWRWMHVFVNNLKEISNKKGWQL